MARYDYKCPNGHMQEEFHGMNEEPRVLCNTCSEPMTKQFSPTRNECFFDHSDPEGTLWKDSKFNTPEAKQSGWRPFIP